MSLTLTAVLLGIVEGLTEFLPVSSTGHLILATRIFGYDDAQRALFNVVIQLGAILAVVVLYWRTFWAVAQGLLKREPGAIAFVRNLLLAFLPAAVIGFILHKKIEALLANAVVVAWAFIIGGVVILVIERLAKQRRSGGIADVPMTQALGVGFAQCLAMVPGVSRSGATIMGALAMGIERRTAAEFSFFLAIPTMLGATVLELVTKRHELMTNSARIGGAVGVTEIAIGFVVSFVVALGVIRLFVSYVSKHGFAPFAYYRIAAGVLALVLLRGH